MLCRGGTYDHCLDAESLQDYNDPAQGRGPMRKKKNSKGVTVVEYAIMLALIAIAIAVAAPNITSAVVGVFSRASSVMNP